VTGCRLGFDGCRCGCGKRELELVDGVSVVTSFDCCDFCDRCDWPVHVLNKLIFCQPVEKLVCGVWIDVSVGSMLYGLDE
jgi:hypothetical protein